MDLLTEGIEKGTIHLFNYCDNTIIFDVTTNSIFSSPVYIDDLNINHVTTIDISSDIEQLRKKGYFEESNECFSDNRIFKSLCLIITRDCNFSCSYCFAENNKKDTTIMSNDVIEASIDLIVDESRERKNIEIDFFGGEPLLGIETIRHGIDYAKKIQFKTGKKFHYSLTTNASLLNDEIINYLENENISLILSLDGCNSTNDMFRKDKAGNGTFNEVYRNIMRVIKNRNEGYYVRGTYTSETNNIFDNVKYMYDSGIKKISMEPVVTTNKYLSIDVNDLEFIKDQYEKLAEWYIETKKIDPELSFYHFELNLEDSPCVQKLMTSCGAGVEYLSISPDGSIFPCHQFDGNNEYKLGNVSEGINSKELLDKLRLSTNVKYKENCLKCWARYLCGGGCLAGNYNINGNIDKTYELGCEIQKIRLETALYVQSKLNQ